MIDDISVVIITRNEESRLPATLAHLTEFSDISVVDSASTDRTREIAAEAGASVVSFDWDQQYPKKKQWALEHAPIRNRWVLLLDADEYPSDELLSELRSLAPHLGSSTLGAYDINLLYRFAGTLLRHGHVVTKRSLIHVDRARFPVIDDLAAPGIREVEGHYQPETDAPVGALRSRLIHDDRDPVTSWFARHNRYSDWEAYLRTHSATRKEAAAKRTRQGQVFDAVPFKPLVFFVYSYVVRLGFLDGRAGFDYAVALSTYYWQIGLKTRELRQVGSSRHG